MNTAVHIVARGLVQGVGFRWFVLREAGRLGLRGWVRNMDQGDLEILAEGDRSVLQNLIGEVKAGPRSARVIGLTVDWQEPTGEFSRFEVR